MPSEHSYSGKTAYQGPVAACYDSDRISEPLWAVEQAFLREWIATLSPGSTVLDLPVGTGRFLPLYAARGLRVCGIDISPDMIAEAAKRRSGPVEECDLRVGDAEHLTLADESVDRVVCWRLVHLLPSAVLRRVLGEFNRVCRGEIVLQVLAWQAGPARSPLPWGRLRATLRRLWRRLARRRPESPWAHIATFEHTDDELCGLCSDAGLRVEKTVTLGENAGRPVVVYHLRRR